ncbi:MAG TPA: hypothetical protein DDZ68_02940 [Parvularcula sp.]|nr:hypothetical protein [Parvularcula sp.]HBS31177.1 hypothetical protein [Parvularcula sp.]
MPSPPAPAGAPFAAAVAPSPSPFPVQPTSASVPATASVERPVRNFSRRAMAFPSKSAHPTRSIARDAIAT